MSQLSHEIVDIEKKLDYEAYFKYYRLLLARGEIKQA